MSTSDPLEEDYQPLVTLTLTYIKRYHGYHFLKNHFIRFLKENGLVTSIAKALKQLDSFLMLYFPESVLRKSFKAVANKRASPYSRPTFGHKIPTVFNTEVAPISQYEVGPAPAMPVPTPYNITVNVFNDHGTSTTTVQRGKGSKNNKTALVAVEAFLPDDSKTRVYMPVTDTVDDLRNELRKRLLAKYPIKTEDEIPIEKFRIKARGGWGLNLADRLGDVIHENTIIFCNYYDN